MIKPQNSVATYQSLNDLQIISNSQLANNDALTVCALLRDEMYFLPAFLQHYRNLGISRFIFLDDRSVDGSREFLIKQPDVMLVESAYRYGDTFYFGNTVAPEHRRMVHVWKTLLLRNYCLGQWAVSVDLDEFIMLPKGLTLEVLTQQLNSAKGTAVPGVMLDVYPDNIDDLTAADSFDPFGKWYFDARKHIEYNAYINDFHVHYTGARSRLLQDFQITFRRPGLVNWLRRCAGHEKPAKPVELFKNIIVKTGADDFFISSHRTTHRIDPRFLLPIVHYKFTHDLFRRTVSAIDSQEYFKGSREYLILQALLMEMHRKNASFKCKESRLATEFSNFSKSGNAMLEGHS